MKEGTEEQKGKVKLSKAQGRPMTFTLVSSLENICESLKGTAENEVSALRKNLVEIIESIGYEEIVETAGLH